MIRFAQNEKGSFGHIRYHLNLLQLSMQHQQKEYWQRAQPICEQPSFFSMRTEQRGQRLTSCTSVKHLNAVC